MPAPIPLPKELAGRLFTTAQARAAGLTPEQLSGTSVRRLVHGVYVDARVPADPSQVLDAVEIRCPGAVWIGRAAVEAWGLPTPLPNPPARAGQGRPDVPSRLPHVLIAAGAHRRTPRAGFLVTVAQVREADVVTRAGRRVLRPAVLMTWLAREWSLEDLVAFGDEALRRRRMTLAELDAAIGRRAGQPGIARCRVARGLLSARSASPMESRMRVAFVLAGLPCPEVNVQISWTPDGADGEAADTLGELDMVWRRAKVAVEYDGEPHAGPRARSHDWAKAKLFERHGWVVVRVTAWDYFNRLDSVIAEVQALLAARGTR